VSLPPNVDPHEFQHGSLMNKPCFPASLAFDCEDSLDIGSCRMNMHVRVRGIKSRVEIR